MLYTGKKQDTWYAIDLALKKAQKVVSLDELETSCPLPQKAVYYLGRTEYTISIFDSLTQSLRWNATFYNFSSMISSQEEIEQDDLVHLSADQNGEILTISKNSGHILWAQTFKATVVGLYTLHRNGLTQRNFETVSMDALQLIKKLNSPLWYSKNHSDQNKILNLSPAMFLGRLHKGLFAIPTLVGEKTRFIAQSGSIPLLPSRNDDELFKASVYPLGYVHYPASWLVHSQLIDHHSHGPINEEQDRLVIPFDEKIHFYLVAMVPTVISIICAVFTCIAFRRNRTYVQPLATSMSANSSSGASECGSSGHAPVISHEKFVIGKISFDPQKVLGTGCFGTTVYEGTFEERPVAIKRIVPQCLGVAEREVELLRETDHHSNVVRYFCMEKDSVFRYIALELGCSTLKEYVEKSLDFSPNLDRIKILYQALLGLNHLHNLTVCHRDVKPENIIISMPNTNGVRRVMISDFGLCKKLNPGHHSFSMSTTTNLVGTLGWIAPEIVKNKGTSFKPTCSVDIFSMGCVFYYVITGGYHPFSDAHDETDKQKRQLNIEADMSSLKHLFDLENSSNLIAYDLVSSMINKDPNRRPSAAKALLHPLFWNSDKQLQFLQDVSDAIEKEAMTNPAIQALESNAYNVVRNNWRLNLTTELQLDLRKFRNYDGSSVRDLLRAMRNKKHHYRELPDDVKEALGAVPDGFVSYFTSRFPRLLIHTYKSLSVLQDEPSLRKYYMPLQIM